ncbi:hypothetical protein RHODGE_RHODGE_03497 [Rhodoplanes serenus]|uniref:Uncharacterized protein n=2 Tax=Nitrobacteraceae TaxID=41294 RepID=A0A3S4FBE7_9BRAD|nr:hypothetical protein RHODGE_RHODGE_03497 [Rhodoplanes serenus]
MQRSDNLFGSRETPLELTRRGMPRMELPSATAPSGIGGMVVAVVLAMALGAGAVVLVQQLGLFGSSAAVQSRSPVASPVVRPRVTIALETVQQNCSAQARSGMNHPGRADANEIYGDMTGRIAAVGEFLECLARTEPARFCRPADKQHLVEKVKQYFLLAQTVKVSAKTVAGGGGGLGPAGMIAMPPLPAGGEAAVGAAVLDAMANATRQPSLMEALRALAREGYIRTSDFGMVLGFGVPEPIAEALKDVPRKKNVCS